MKQLPGRFPILNLRRTGERAGFSFRDEILTWIRLTTNLYIQLPPNQAAVFAMALDIL